MAAPRYSRVLRTIPLLIALFAPSPVRGQSHDGRPIADAGSSRYAAQDPVVLDGASSHDPDISGPSSYRWRQIAGPTVTISDANAATPTISGFIQTDVIQECEFELVVSDGDLASQPDTVKVIVVPTLTEGMMVLENDSFDPQKPTIVYFGGGSASNLGEGGGEWNSSVWEKKANVISFDQYVADPGSIPGLYAGSELTFSRCADMIIVYLSVVAPDYKGAIQTMGLSLGGVPAIDVALRLNKIYADARYMINRVSFLDATTGVLGGIEYAARVADFLANPVDGEQCWLDSYDSAYGSHYPDALNVGFGPDATVANAHTLARKWYRASLANKYANKFNHGIVAGAYWSVVGPGKNLQLASTPDEVVYMYTFRWVGGEDRGQYSYSGRLPEPVTLVGPVEAADSTGFVLTCEESENAVGYQLLVGSDPYRVMDYNIICDTPTPPSELLTTLPFDQTWWTVRVRDQYGSTIYADPMCIDAVTLSFPVENLTRARRYGRIQDAIYEASAGSEIIAEAGIYRENIDFKGKNLTVRSTDPANPDVVATTVINGGDQGSVVTLFGTQETNCVLAGLTITGGTVGISCCDASPTIRNCTIESNGPNAIEFWQGYEPTIIDCTILGQVVEVEVNDRTLVAHWALDETKGSIAHDSAGAHDGTLNGDPLWRPTAGRIDGALAFDGTDDYVSTDFVVLNPADGPFSVFAWIKGGAPGQVILSQIGGANWLLADTSQGNLMTQLRNMGRPSSPPLWSETMITDGNWHHVGLTWDGSNRMLYIDGVEAAKDAHAQFDGSAAGLYIGAGKNLDVGTFFSGLIDDVRIYNRAVKP